jgi:hypothetical protein
MDFIRIKGIHTNLSETDIVRQYEADKGIQRRWGLLTFGPGGFIL